MPQQITPTELASRQSKGERFLLLDVRQPWENQAAALEGSVLIPLQDLPQRHEELRPEPGQRVVAYCHHGVRSYNAAEFLEHLGHGEVFSLAGGIAAWSREVDSKVPTY